MLGLMVADHRNRLDFSVGSANLFNHLKLNVHYNSSEKSVSST